MSETQYTPQERVTNLMTTYTYILDIKKNFQKTSYSSISANKTYQKFLLTDDGYGADSSYPYHYKYRYWENRQPAAQGLCLFNKEGGD